MPRTYRKKRFKRKRRNRRPRKRIVRFRRNKIAIGGFPDRYAARLKYTQFVDLDMSSLTSGVGVQHRFRANSLYAPSYDSVGHQPRAFDELAQIYDHYTVVGSKLHVRFNMDTDVLANVGFYCFANLQDTANSLPTLLDMCEARKSNCKYMSRNTTGSNPVSLTVKYSPYKMFGIPKKDSLINNSRLTSGTTTNPLEDAIYSVGVVCERATSTDPSAVVARVDLEFIAIFTERRPIRSS